MSDAARLQETRAAIRVMQRQLAARADALRQPGESAAKHFARCHSDDLWVAFDLSLRTLADVADELADLVDARAVVTRREPGPLVAYINNHPEAA